MLLYLLPNDREIELELYFKFLDDNTFITVDPSYMHYAMTGKKSDVKIERLYYAFYRVSKHIDIDKYEYYSIAVKIDKPTIYNEKYPDLRSDYKQIFYISTCFKDIKDLHKLLVENKSVNISNLKGIEKIISFKEITNHVQKIKEYIYYTILL